MFKKFILPLILLASSCALAQTATDNTAQDDSTTPAIALSSDELLSRSQAIFVTTNSYFVKKEQLEQGLANRKELGSWGIHVVTLEKDADLVLKVERLPFQSKFAFTFTDRATRAVVLGGQVTSLFGTVAGRIADRLVDRLKEIHKRDKRKHLAENEANNGWKYGHRILYKDLAKNYCSLGSCLATFVAS